MHAPRERAVAILLRHSVRDPLPPGDAAYHLPITAAGHALAFELGAHLRGRLQTMRSSPLTRCIQTAEAICSGAGGGTPIHPDHSLGDPGVFVVDDRQAAAHWERLGHERVVQHLVAEAEPLPGLARPDEAASFLVRHMLTVAADQPGVHVFVTHDSLITVTVARMLGLPFGPDDWPTFLEGALLWRDGAGIHLCYRDHEATLDHLRQPSDPSPPV